MHNRLLVDKIMKQLFLKDIDCTYKLSHSGSAYIYLDHGAIGTLRISNHDSRLTKVFRYNIRTDKNKMEVAVCNNIPTYTFPIKDLDLLLNFIIMDKKAKINKFGEIGYHRYKLLMLHKGIFKETNRLLYVPDADILERGD